MAAFQVMNDVESIWAKVRFWRLVKKVFLIIDLVLIVFTVLIWVNGDDNFLPKSNLRQNNNLSIIARQGANMRENPDKDAIILYSIPYKTKIQFIGSAYSKTKSKWYKVDYKAKVGWVWSKNVKNV